VNSFIRQRDSSWLPGFRDRNVGNASLQLDTRPLQSDQLATPQSGFNRQPNDRLKVGVSGLSGRIEQPLKLALLKSPVSRVIERGLPNVFHWITRNPKAPFLPCHLEDMRDQRQIAPDGTSWTVSKRRSLKAAMSVEFRDARSRCASASRPSCRSRDSSVSALLL